MKVSPKKEVKADSCETDCMKLRKCEKPLWKKSKKQNKNDYKKNTELLLIAPALLRIVSQPIPTDLPFMFTFRFLNFPQQLKEDGMQCPVAKSRSFGANDAQREELTPLWFSFLSDFLFLCD